VVRIDLAAGGADLTTVDNRISPDSEPEDLLAALATYAALLVAVVETSPPTRRGFHPYGPADPSGFARSWCTPTTPCAAWAARPPHPPTCAP
jgi:hypothetical protein